MRDVPTSCLSYLVSTAKIPEVFRSIIDVVGW
jgi:hypothetical protein